MEQKTKVHAEDCKQELLITREFDLPLHLLFRAYSEAELLEQWMGTKVLKLESRKHGSYRIETSDARGNVAMRASGVIHDFVPDSRIVRTFEMEGVFPAQLEYMDFERLTEETSKLTLQMVFRSVALRDQLLKMPFVYGINMAHNQLEKIVSKLK